MASITPYLTFNGNCEEAFLFYKSVFGTEFEYIGKFGEMPPSDNENQHSLTQEEANRVMHVSLPIGKGTILMGSDTTSQSGDAVIGTNVSMSLNTESRDEANALFNGLSADGTVIMAMQNTFWDAYFGMFVDKFGIHWMINFDEIPQK